ncbi:MAG: inositol monophosphatase family protein [Armatimonadetes bacterium]|nr:inositol monophosphatase family protein [Armatimonadota bacterium]
MTSDLLNLTVPIVQEAGKLARSLRDTMEVRLKQDGSLVSDADTLVETRLREQLAPLVPGATTWGEEMGFEEPAEPGWWLIDPIDGTSNYVFGQPLWGVSVALYRQNRLELGVVDLPDLGWTFAAALGAGATKNGEPLAAVKSGPIARHELLGHADDNQEAFSFLPGKRRHLGAFVIEAMFMAAGGLRAMTSTKCKLYDAAASIVVLRELGAEVRTARGCLFEESEWARPVLCEPFAIVGPDAWPWETLED